MSKSIYEEGPFSLIATTQFQTGETDQYTYGATQMACVHNCFLRAFHGIYAHAATVPPTEHHTFVSYAYQCYIGLHTHHEGEERTLFPELEASMGEKGLMDVNVRQHASFHAGITAFGDYLDSVLRGDLGPFSGARLRAILEGFAPALNQYLHEIPTLLSLVRYGDALDFRDAVDREGQHAMAGLSKMRVLPVFFLNHDVEYEDGLHAGFPPIPAQVKRVLMHASCDFSGRLKQGSGKA